MESKAALFVAVLLAFASSDSGADDDVGYSGTDTGYASSTGDVYAPPPTGYVSGYDTGGAYDPPQTDTYTGGDYDTAGAYDPPQTDTYTEGDYAAGGAYDPPPSDYDGVDTYTGDDYASGTGYSSGTGYVSVLSNDTYVPADYAAPPSFTPTISARDQRMEWTIHW